MWTEEYQADYIRFHREVAAERDFVAGMQVWNFADFAAVQSIARVGGPEPQGHLHPRSQAQDGRPGAARVLDRAGDGDHRTAIHELKIASA